jgi:hypothetical protein
VARRPQAEADPGHLLRAPALERLAQQLGQLRHHALCRLHVAVNEGGDGVQDVEEEVRLQPGLAGAA